MKPRFDPRFEPLDAGGQRWMIAKETPRVVQVVINSDLPPRERLQAYREAREHVLGRPTWAGPAIILMAAAMARQWLKTHPQAAALGAAGAVLVAVAIAVIPLISDGDPGDAGTPPAAAPTLGSTPTVTPSPAVTPSPTVTGEEDGVAEPTEPPAEEPPEPEPADTGPESTPSPEQPSPRQTPPPESTPFRAPEPPPEPPEPRKTCIRIQVPQGDVDKRICPPGLAA